MGPIVALLAAAGGRSKIIAGVQFVFEIAFASAIGGIRYNADGTYETFTGAGPSPQGEWVQPASAADEWEIRASVTSGVSVSGTLNTWLPLTVNQEWALIRSSNGFYQSVLKFEFRRVGGTAAEVTIDGNVLEVEVV